MASRDLQDVIQTRQRNSSKAERASQTLANTQKNAVKTQVVVFTASMVQNPSTIDALRTS